MGYSFWLWAAHGKHPAAKDYLRLGRGFPLMRALAEWVERGYRNATAANNAGNGHSTWLFWGRGIRKEEIACGLLKESCDDIGRPYPFLLMGTGPLSDWEKNWDLMSLACERTWERTKHISDKLYDDIRRLEADIVGIRPPSAAWESHVAMRTTMLSCGSNNNFHATANELPDMDKHMTSLAEKNECMIRVEGSALQDQIIMIQRWHCCLKERMKSAPNAVFLGGSPEETYLVVYNRPLSPNDFMHLLSVSR